MRALLSRIWRGGSARRSLDAGAAGIRWEGTPALSNLNSALQAASGPIRQRAAYFISNNPYACRAVHALTASAVGTGIQPQSRHGSAAVRERLHNGFAAWAAQADAAQRMDFYGLQALVFRQLVETGESFVRFIWTTDRRGRPTFRLQVIHPDQIDPTMNRDLAGGARIRAGVELDSFGAPVAYHVLPGRPSDMAGVNWSPIRVPAEDMVHVMETLEPGQVRGLSAFASVLLRLSTLDKAEDAQLVRQMVAAMLMGFVVDPNGDAAGVAGEQTGSVLVGGLEPGTLKTLAAGQDIKFSEPANVGDGADFLKGQLRAVAAGLGITYEMLTGDLSGVNYSSIRAGLIEHRRRVDALRWHVLIPQLCTPVWERFVRLQVLLGEIPAADFDRAPDAWESVDWFPPAWPWVDPLKDVEAEKAAVDAGFKSRAQVINERGEDPDTVDAMRAADKDREGRLGLDSHGAAPAPQGAPKAEESLLPPADGAPTNSEKDTDDE